MKNHKKKIIEKYLFCIDPSIRSLGWAEFHLDLRNNKSRYINSGQIKADEENKDFKLWDKNRKLSYAADPVLCNLNKKRHDANDWVLKIDYMVDCVYDHAQSIVNKFDVIIELPYGARVMNADDITKLTSFCFAVRALLVTCDSVKDIYLAPVSVWKGQVSKEMTQRRINRTWGLDLGKSRADEADAIGIGTFYIKEILKFKCTK